MSVKVCRERGFAACTPDEFTALPDTAHKSSTRFCSLMCLSISLPLMLVLYYTPTFSTSCHLANSLLSAPNNADLHQTQPMSRTSILKLLHNLPLPSHVVNSRVNRSLFLPSLVVGSHITNGFTSAHPPQRTSLSRRTMRRDIHLV